MSEKLTKIEQVTLERCMLPERLERLDDVLAHRSLSLTIVLDRVHNYHNISAVLRSADAFGVARIHLVGESFEYCKNITQGSERWMDLRRHKSAEEARKHLLSDAYSLVVLEPEDHAQSKNLPHRSIPVSSLPFERKLALIFGNEHEGVSPKLAEAAEFHAFIPMHGFVESLNISVACAICLFCSTLKASEPEKRSAPLPPSEMEELKAKWLKNSVKHSSAILREVNHRSGRKR